MTLWYDTTDVWDWPSPQLTGIQRVVVQVLGDVVRNGTDVRLFRFDRAGGTLLAIAPSELAPTIRRYGGLVDRTQDAAPAAGIRTRAREWLSTRAGWTRHGRDAGSGRAAPRRLFAAGDVCLSLSLTWGLDGYWPAMATHKRAGVTLVQLLHDIAFVVHPQWVLPDWTVMGAQWMRGVTEHADLLLVTSEFQRAEVERYVREAGLPRRPIETVRLGDDPPGLTVERGVRPRAEPPFVLCVSGFYPRKNHDALYHVWRRLALRLGDRCPGLVLVGEAPRMPLEVLAQIARDPLTRDRVRVRFDVDDDALAELFTQCLFTVYPSHYEGWGLPVAESLRLGRYCIASSAASLPEVGGDLVDYVDPFDRLSLYDAIEHALTNPSYVRQREALIRDRYRPHSWRETARQILDRVGAVSAQVTARTPRG